MMTIRRRTTEGFSPALVSMTQLRCPRVLDVAINNFTRAIAVVVCASEWQACAAPAASCPRPCVQIYSFPEFQHIVRVRSRRSSRLASAKFISETTVLLTYQVCCMPEC